MRRRSSASLAEACGAARPEAVLEGPLEGMVRSIKGSLSLAGPWPGEAGGHRFLVYMVYLAYIFLFSFCSNTTEHPVKAAKRAWIAENPRPARKTRQPKTK
jgi:hypothetical protein